MFALIAVIYFAVIGIISWNSLPTHWVALLFIGLAILSAEFVFTFYRTVHSGTRVVP